MLSSSRHIVVPRRHATPDAHNHRAFAFPSVELPNEHYGTLARQNNRPQLSLMERLPQRVSCAGPQWLALSSSAWHCVVLNPEPVHQTAKCVWMDVEDGSCTIGSADHPAGSLKNSQNMPALYTVEGFCGVRLAHSSRFSSPVGFRNRWEIRLDCYGRALRNL